MAQLTDQQQDQLTDWYNSATNKQVALVVTYISMYVPNIMEDIESDYDRDWYQLETYEVMDYLIDNCSQFVLDYLSNKLSI